MKKLFFRLIVPLLLGLGAISSFFREVVIAYYYGTSRDLEIFRIAFSIPYALFQSLGTTLVGALLPILIHEGEDLIVIIKKQVHKIFLIITIIALTTSSWQATILAPGFDTMEIETLTANLLICWWILLISSFIFPIRLILQEKNKKNIVASTSLFYSLFFILFIFIFNNIFIKFDLAIISVVSTVFVYFMYRLFGYVPNRTKPTKQINKIEKRIQKIIIGSFIYILFLAIPRLLDKAVASKMDIGVIANLEYAMNFYVAFGILIGTSFTIIYAKKIALEYRDTMNITWLFRIVGIPFFIGALVSILILPFSEELVRIAYLRGAFSVDNVQAVTEILYWFLVTLPFMISGMILLQVLAAYSIFMLIGLAILKVIIKIVWMIYFSTISHLEIFGQSTLAMELVSIIFILYILKRKENSVKQYR